MSIIASNTDLNLEVVVEKGSNHSDDTSSDETDPRRQLEKPNTGGRSYECTFCKRGFTNAQALGGHMNIHRKDKLKAKQKSTQESSSPLPLPNSKNTLYTSSRYLTQISTDQQQRFCPSPRTTPQHVGYMFYPSYRPVVDDRNDDGSRPPGNLGLHGELMEANLTLRIGQEDGEEEEESKEELEKNEVDLELRLGRHHKYS